MGEKKELFKSKSLSYKQFSYPNTYNFIITTYSLYFSWNQHKVVHHRKNRQLMRLRPSSNLTNILLKGNKNCSHAVSTCKAFSTLYQGMVVKLSVCIIGLWNKMVFLSIKWVMLPSIKKDTDFHHADTMSYLLNLKLLWIWNKVTLMIK